MTCKDCIHYDVCDDCGLRFIVDVEDKCKEAKDKSRFVELPCKVGDKLYFIYPNDEFNEGCSIETVVDVSVRGVYISPFISGECAEQNYFVPWENLNREYFLTREEAEKALERRNGK